MRLQEVERRLGRVRVRVSLSLTPTPTPTPNPNPKQVALTPGGVPPLARQGHAACAVGGALYVFGGWRLRECQVGSLCTSSVL